MLRVSLSLWKNNVARYEKAYIQTGAEDWIQHESIFNGYKIEREGIVVLSDGKRVISSNDSSMLGEMVAEDPYIKAFDSHPKSDALVRMAENGKYIMVNLQNVIRIISMFLPEREIFVERGMVDVVCRRVLSWHLWFCTDFVHQRLVKKQLCQ